MARTTPWGVPVTREAIRALLAEAEAERDPARYALLMQNYRIAAAEALPALLDALDAAERNRDDAMIRAAEDQDEHSAQRAALAAEVERLRAAERTQADDVSAMIAAVRDALRAEVEQVRHAAAADEETMRLLYADVEQARGQVERLRADITAARDIAAARGGVPGRGYAESAVDSVTWLVEALEEARAAERTRFEVEAKQARLLSRVSP